MTFLSSTSSDPSSTAQDQSSGRGRRGHYFVLLTVLIVLVGGGISTIQLLWGPGGEAVFSTFRIERNPDRAGLIVNLTLTGIRSSTSLRLTSRAAQSLITRGNLSVVDGAGNPVPFGPEIRNVEVRSRAGKPFQRSHEDWVVSAEGPLPSELHVRYTVTSVTAESGEGPAYTGPESGLLTGSQAFLFPGEDSRVGGNLRCVLEAQDVFLMEDDRVAEPWERLGGALLFYGRFEEWRLGEERGGPRVFLDRNLPDERLRELRAQAETLFGRLEGLFLLPRDLPVVFLSGPESGSSLLTPRDCFGIGVDMDLSRPSWRWEQVVRACVSRSLRSISPRPEDAWFFDAFPGFVAGRLLGEVGLEDPELRLRRQRRSYALSYRKDRSFSLARYATAPGSVKTLLREAVSPLVMHQMEAELGREKGDLLAVVSRCLSDEPARLKEGLCARVLDLTREDMLPLYRKFVGGNESLLPSSPPPFSSESLMEGSSSTSLRLLVSSRTRGDMESCAGCPGREERMERRREMASEETAELPLLVFDAGIFLPPATFSRRPGVETLESRLESLGQVPFHVLVASAEDLLHGADMLVPAADAYPFDLLSANVRGLEEERLFLPFSVLPWGNLTAGVIGVSAPLADLQMSRLQEKNMDGIVFLDPVVESISLAKDLRTQVDLVVVVGALSPAAIRKLVKTPGLIDLVVSTDRFLEGLPFWDRSGHADGTVVLYPMSGPEGMDEAVLFVDPSQAKCRISRFEWRKRMWSE